MQCASSQKNCKSVLRTLVQNCQTSQPINEFNLSLDSTFSKKCEKKRYQIFQSNLSRIHDFIAAISVCLCSFILVELQMRQNVYFDLSAPKNFFLVINKIVFADDDRLDFHFHVHCDVKSASFERKQSSARVSGSLWEN